MLFRTLRSRNEDDDPATRGILEGLSHERLIREDEEQNELFKNLEIGIDRLADDLSILVTNTGVAIWNLKRL